MPELNPVTPAAPAPVAAPAAADTTQQTTSAMDTAQQTAAQTTTGAQATETSWPDDWRQKYAAGDEKKLKKLERYGSPQAALDALFNAQSRISSGELKAPLAPDATPEEKTAWRLDNGIPEEPSGYDLTLPNGLIVGEADKPFVDDFLAVAHEGNFKQEDVSRALSWFFDKQETMVAEQAARDTEVRMKTFDQLRDEFGPGYKNEVKIAYAVLDNAPEGVRESFLAGRLADGSLIGDSPEIIRWLNTLSRELNPVGVVVPGSGSNAVQAVEAERETLRKMMGDRKSEYWKGPNAEKNQARYRDLTTALSKGR